MKFLAAIEFGLFVAFLMLIITQVILPAMLGRPLFPMFRSRPKAARQRLAEAIEDRDVSAIEAEAERIATKKTVAEPSAATTADAQAPK